jgi:hypothetical protein
VGVVKELKDLLLDAWSDDAPDRGAKGRRRWFVLVLPLAGRIEAIEQLQGCRGRSGMLIE